MDISVINIGNSRGIRLPKKVLEKYQIMDAVEMTLHKDGIMLKPKPVARKGWDEAFSTMHETGEDRLLIDDVFDDEAFD